LRDAQYNLFQPCFSPEEFYNTRSIDPYNRITLYANQLFRVITKGLKQDSKRRCFVISDETILGYGGIVANVSLLCAVINKLKEKLLPIQVEVHILITIRQQISYIKSFYSYDYLHQRSRYKTFKDFVRSNLDNPGFGPFASLEYKSLKKTLSLMFGDTVDSIKIVPYEIIEDSPKDFLLQLFENVIANNSALKNSIQTFPSNASKVVNSNRVKGASGEVINLVVKPTALTKLIEQIFSFSRFIQSKNRLVMHLIQGVKPYFISFFKRKYKKKELIYDEETISLLDDLSRYYKERNAKIDFIDRDILKQKGYI